MEAQPPKKFTPFTHDDLELKKELINYARGLAHKSGFENGLASALIYSSFAEYLAEHLLKNLKHFAYQGTYSLYAGVIFIDERDEGKKPKKATLGQNIGDLRRFHFPDKDALLNCFNKIAEARNNIIHKFAKEDLQGLQKLILSDIEIIKTETEEVLSKIDIIYAGLGKILVEPSQSAQPAQPTQSATPPPKDGS